MIRTLILLLTLGVVLLGQPQSYEWSAPAPPSPLGVTVQTIGVAANNVRYYWVVANYPIGKSFPAGPAISLDGPQSLSALNYVSVKWNAMPSASSYDVLKTTTPTPPIGTCVCALSIAQVAPGYNDTGAALLAYTGSPARQAAGFIRLDNLNYASPRFIISPGMSFGTGIIDAGGFTVGGLAPLGRYLRGNATAFVPSSGSAAGAGACPANQFAISNNDDAAPTCVTATLASAQFANQGTTTTVLHGNAAGNPAWGAVALGADVSGLLPAAAGGTGANNVATAGRYLKGDGANFTTSTGSASGTGACGANQFVTGTNSDAAPTCSAIPSAAIPANLKVQGVPAVFDGGGGPLAPGMVAYTRVPYACTINGWSIVIDAGTATFDVWKVARGANLPTNANTITGGQEPAIGAGNAIMCPGDGGCIAMDKWTTAVVEGDIFGFNIDAVAGGATWAQVVVTCSRT